MMLLYGLCYVYWRMKFKLIEVELEVHVSKVLYDPIFVELERVMLKLIKI